MVLEDKIFQAKAKNWAKLVSERADKLCEIRKNEDDLFIKILNGKIFDDAVNQIALEIKSGLYDSMLMPIECNK